MNQPPTNLQKKPMKKSAKAKIKPQFTEIHFYPNLIPLDGSRDSAEAFMRTVADAGFTHVQINHVPDMIHPEAISNPNNIYLWFASLGPALDLFVSSDLSFGIYPEVYLERNRQVLLCCAEAARRNGLKPVLYLCEPKFVPERFFARHPQLRGARVDNPTCSKTPLYALCVDREEVLEHYAVLMGKMMDLVPDLAAVTIFTSDSGAGFDYNPDSYAGPNGAGFNRQRPLENRVMGWLRTLLEAGQKRNPEFRVQLTSGFQPELRAKILELAPAGIVGGVFGQLSWTGGLEEQWAYHQRRFDLKSLDRVRESETRTRDFAERFKAAAVHGREPLVHVALPTYEYLCPLRYVPHPFEAARLMKALAGIGARKMIAWGTISPRALVPWDINNELMKMLNDHIEADTDTAIRGIAERWVGNKHAAALVEAWRASDRAITRRPLWQHAAGGVKQLLPGPIVPDLTRLTRAEVAYYWQLGFEDNERISGPGFFVPHEPDEKNRDWVLRHMYEEETLPVLQGAAEKLDREAKSASGETATILGRQRDHIQLAYLYQRSYYNWYEAGRYIVPGKQPGTGRLMPQIVDDEIQVTRDLIKLVEGRPDQFLILSPMGDWMMYGHGPGYVAKLQERILVMQAHRDDPPRDLTPGLKALHFHLTKLDREHLRVLETAEQSGLRRGAPTPPGVKRPSR